MTGKILGSGFAALVLMFGGSAAMAQATSQAAAKPASSAKKQNIDQDIKMLRKDVRAEKSKIMLEALNLNDDQTKKFTAIYNEYENQLGKLNDARLANIKDYAANYDKMTDAKADELYKNASAYYKNRYDLLANYYDKVRAALGTGTAARFVQVEATLLNIIDLQIQANLPLVWTPTSGG